MTVTIKIGTRGSPLALKQTHMVRDALLQYDPSLNIEIVVIKTSGDWRPEQGEVRLDVNKGGKGQFAKEIEEALQAGRVDIAVHSMKDMETHMPDGLVIDHILPREDVRDCVILSRTLQEAGIESLQVIPVGAKIGTASVRRQSFLLTKRSDFKVTTIRGNVQTRLEKVRNGQVDASFLAVAGLKRLGLQDEIDFILAPEDMLPASGQGAVGIQMRAGESDLAQMLSAISCERTLACVSAERAALGILDGSCHTPIGAYARIEEDAMKMDLAVASLDGSQFHSLNAENKSVQRQDAIGFGERLARQLKSEIPPDLLKQSAE